ncbi:hypothetical protein LDL08_11350 [Nonomuraea glycinis]|uniref:Pycsar effector protein domain-containing protein n=1 Tax=Nonomuraea glycinis TaxID=2047744 RepID=A0A918A1K9_9ACTN|nr:hypothetical protein [Nonomuraea glycinis]MCA2176781.1 hypothetical protein [Nonomuraea glycinis]GGP03323.1 hypothetical protein GCM10012278_14080 [Nonomuraea glycinis]
MKTNASDAGHEEVVSALTAATVCQSYVQHADTKAGVFIVVQAGGASMLAAQMGPVFTILRGCGWVALAGLVLLIGFAVSFVASGYHLVQALRPDLRPTDRPSRFSIVNRPTRNAGHGNPGQQAEEAWATVQVLSEIAARKHRRIARSIPWICLLVVTTIGAIALGAAAS